MDPNSFVLTSRVYDVRKYYELQSFFYLQINKPQAVGVCVSFLSLSAPDCALLFFPLNGFAEHISGDSRPIFLLLVCWNASAPQAVLCSFAASDALLVSSYWAANGGCFIFFSLTGTGCRALKCD